MVSLPLFSQQQQKLYLAGKSDGHQVKLRWAPSNFELFEAGWKNGYVLHRSRKSSPISEVIDTIYPNSLESLRNLVEAKTPIFAQMAGAIIQSMQEPILLEDRSTTLSNALLAADSDPIAARSMGLSFQEELTEINEPIIYSISLKLHDSVEHTSSTIVYPREIYRYPEIDLTATAHEDSKIHLAWPNEGYTAFFIDRAVDSTFLDFETLNTLPYIYARSTDSIVDQRMVYFVDSVENDHLYYYRVRGLDLFADLGPHSQIVGMQAKDRTPPEVVSNLEFDWIADSTISIQWQLNETKDVNQILIKKHFHIDDPLETMDSLNPEAESYVCKVKSLRPQLWYVCTVDDEGNQACANPVVASVPNLEAPSMPTGVTGSIDSQGVLTLHWNKNLEDDLDGYLVFMANDSSHIFSRIVGSPIRRNIYQDSLPLKNLSEKIYYRIAAVDLLGNISKLSDIATSEKPDFIAPNPPIIRKTKLLKSGEVHLQWSQSLSPDVIAYCLWRRKGTGGWDHLDTLKRWSNEYYDKLEASGNYRYRLVAIDDAANLSASVFEPTVVYRAPTINHGISGVEINIVNDDFMEVTWEYPIRDVRFAIYRQNRKGQFTSYKLVDEPKITVSRKLVHAVKIRAIHTDRTKSRLSKIIEL